MGGSVGRDEHIDEMSEAERERESSGSAMMISVILNELIVGDSGWLGE